MAKVLQIVPYDFCPAINGGALRSFYVLKSLAAYHDVHVISPQAPDNLKLLDDPEILRNVTLFSLVTAEKFKSVFSILPEKIADALHTRLLRKSFNAKANTFFLTAFPVFKRQVELVDYDLIIYENIEAMTFLQPYVKKGKRRLPLQILNVHNVDSSLWLQHWISQKLSYYKDYSKNAFSTETKLRKLVNFVFTCSQTDLDVLKNRNNGFLNGSVVPNGVDIALRPFDTGVGKFSRKELIFCGALNTYPNKEGLLWFYHEVFPILKKMHHQIKLNVIGQVTDRRPFSDLINDPDINFVGSVDSVIPYYQKSSIAIVPLKSGSGTRLKILEAMSLGNPVVSTTVGAEGIFYENNKHLLIGDDAEKFAASINILFNDQTKFESIRYQARELVSLKYDWGVISKQINQTVFELLQHEGYHQSKY